MRLPGCLLLGFTLLCGSMAHADDDPLKWSWNCGVSGFYGMEVLRDGTVKPLTDYSDRTPVEIDVKEAGQDLQETCAAWGKSLTRYYIEIKGNQLATRYNVSSCEQSVQIDTESTHIGNQSFNTIEKIESVTTFYSPFTLLVHRDDAGWRFVLSYTDLMTAQDSRQLRATLPQGSISYDPKAGVWFLTGECILTTGH